jgi:lipoprotein LprG
MTVSHHRRLRHRSRLGTLRTFVVATITAVVLASCASDGDSSAATISTDPVEIQTASAEAMSGVQSVRFFLSRTGDPVFIDPADLIALDELEGRFSAPTSAEAVIDVTVSGSLATTVGAVAIGEEIWLSNPLTGEFETLPPGFDIDPSSFFDPQDGWRPLLEQLFDVTFVSEEDRNGAAYHLTATAPAEAMTNVTAGLVSGQDVDIDLWVDPATALVRAMEFATDLDGAQSEWVLEFEDYGEPFEILDPTLDG